jgi:hypothetical protein
MSSVLAAVRHNPHALNYVFGALITITPILYYAYSYTPSPLELESKLVRAVGAADKFPPHSRASPRAALFFHASVPPLSAC